ncbi:HD domain-containing protein [Arsenicicoccus dermatophilus]|uniref:HD domain-containing protein n=1 Tax=Arsenicicoccus dermatophilus TaxID=1076331 RepID=UPI003891FE72
MTISMPFARTLAAALTSELHPRWEHLQAVGQRAEELCERVDLPEVVAVAAWLHDIGYGPAIAHSGFHPLDGARFLRDEGWPAEVTRLVAWHTGAGFEANERGLLAQLEDEFGQPDAADLDALTMVDLATSPTGEPILDVRRIAEILSRYDEGHPVHEAVTASRPSLLASSRRAKERLGLPQDWPVCC